MDRPKAGEWLLARQEYRRGAKVVSHEVPVKVQAVYRSGEIHVSEPTGRPRRFSADGIMRGTARGTVRLLRAGDTWLRTVEPATPKEEE